MRPRISIRGSVRLYVRPSVRYQLCKTAENPPKSSKNNVVVYWSITDVSICPPGLVLSLSVFLEKGLEKFLLFLRRRHHEVTAAEPWGWKELVTKETHDLTPFSLMAPSFRVLRAWPSVRLSVRPSFSYMLIRSNTPMLFHDALWSDGSSGGGRLKIFWCRRSGPGWRRRQETRRRW